MIKYYIFSQNNRTITPPGNSRRAMSELPNVGAKLEDWGLKMCNILLFAIVYGFWNCKYLKFP